MSTYRSALIFTFFGFYIKVCFLKVYQFLLEKRRIQIEFKSYENEIDVYLFVELVLWIILTDPVEDYPDTNLTINKDLIRIKRFLLLLFYNCSLNIEK